MKKSRILAVVMSVLMMISMLPAAVFAAEAASILEGELKIKGTAAVDVTLGADYAKVKPEGLTDEDVSFLWQRKVSESAEDPLVDLSKEKTYKVTAEDIGYKIVLTITGREDKGVTGTLKATSQEVTEAVSQDGQETVPETQEELYEELPEEQSQEVIPEYQEEIYEELPDEPSDETVPEENYEEEIYNDPVDGEELFPDDEMVYSEELSYGDEELTPVDEPEAGDDVYYGDEELTPAEENEMDESLQADYVSYNVEAVTPDGSSVVDFGTIEAGNEGDVERQYVTVRNTGTGVLNFQGLSPDHFMVQDINEPLNAGEEVTLWIQPREGIEAGTYEDKIVYESDELVNASFQAKITVEEAAAEEPSETEEPAADENETDAEEPDDTAVTDPEQNSGEEIPGNEEVPGNEENPGNEDPSDNPENPEDPGDSDEPQDPENPDDPQEPENPDDPQEPVDETKAVIISAETLDFGKATEGYEELPEAQLVTLTNDGQVDIELAPIEESESFTISDFSESIIPVGGSVEFTIQPKAGLKVNPYSEVISIYSTDDEENALASLTAVFEVEKKIVHKLTIMPDALDFGSVTEGYKDAPKAQKVTISNDGNVTENLYQPEGDSFTVGELSTLSLEPGKTCVFTVQPNKGLEAGDYLEPIYVLSESGEEVSVEANLTVKKKEDKSVKLTAVQKPAEITGLANGTEKKASALKLPGTVVIETTKGNMKAKVAWDVKGCAYDPKGTNAQSFKVKGTVTLPDGVKNPNNVSLVTSVKVTVNGYTANVASAADNYITGITANGQYTTKSTISFTAVGAGMDNENPRKGDVRYLPLNWTVVNTNTWTSAPYAASFGMGRSGNYTLSVVFARQEYDGSNWVNKGDQDTKKVSFSVVQAPEQTVTPTPGANQKKAVQTGDDTPIIPFVIALVIAVVLIAGVVIYRKKK